MYQRESLIHAHFVEFHPQNKNAMHIITNKVKTTHQKTQKEKPEGNNGNQLLIWESQNLRS